MGDSVELEGIPDDLWTEPVETPAEPPPVWDSSAADATAAWAATSKARRKGEAPRTSKPRIKRFVQEATEMRNSRDWSKAEPGHLVALYAWCHHQVYGVGSEVLSDGKSYAMATLTAGRMLREDFELNVAEMVGFLRWIWLREHGREKWRRDNGRDGGRIGWRLLFTPRGALITDWRVARARQGKIQE